MSYDAFPDLSGITKKPLYRYLDTNGDGTGTKNANGDYSSTADEFYLAPSAGEIMRIRRLMISIGDTSGMQAQEYGNLGSALSNGISLSYVSDRLGTIDLMDGVPVLTNSQWGDLCYDVARKSWGAGNELLLARWTFVKAGEYLRLNGDKSDKLSITFNDDFSGLLSHYFFCQGFYE